MDPNDTSPYIFNIAFYDEEKLVHLVDGHPQRGVATNQTFDYFYYDILDLDSDYEITLSPVSGGDPDLVISLDPNMKYPTLNNSDMKSTNQFTTDSVVITKDMIKAYTKKLDAK